MIAATGAGRDPALKGFRRGTHRAVAPEVTLARLEPLLDRMGITRVGMLTGLDRIGLPVATAVRPNGRALAVSLGKGVSVAAAKVSAAMEAAEAFHAETASGPLLWASARELAGAVDPLGLPLSPAADPGEDIRSARCLWIAGRELAGGLERWVPFQMVHADYTVSQAEPPRFQATTSGLAAGNVAAEAQLHALYEAVERDAIACWREAGGPGSDSGRAVALDGPADPDIAELLGLFEAAGIGVAVWEVSADIGIPVFVALLMPSGAERSAVEPEIGSGAHLDPAVALSRALTEAAQTRLARISGARDDFEPGSYLSEARRRRRVEAREWLALGRRGARPLDEIAGGFAARPSASLDDDLSILLGALDAAGFGECVWVDLSRPEIGIPVGRVVVPGLEGPWLPGIYRAGERARRRARR